MSLTRRAALQSLPLVAGLARCEASAPQLGSAAAAGGAPAAGPRLVTTSVSGGVRSFAGPAAPEDVEVLLEGGERRRLYELFPNAHDPFGIDPALELGVGRLAVTVTERTAAPADEPWALNMVPFGVALDGVLFDPSGPWYDGGPPDPRNPFDRACSGWQYDSLYPAVARLLGLPLEVRGHVQPGPGGRPGSLGTFHYHGAPPVLLGRLRQALGAPTTPTVVGYSADGYPLIDAYLPGAPRVHLFSGYVLREGARSAQAHTNPSLTPAHEHDGTFVQDWVFDPERKRAQIDAALRDQGQYLGLSRDAVEAGAATSRLADALSGVTLPGGAWAYVLTPDWPEVPRWFAAQPSPSFCAVIPLEGPAGAMGPPARRALYDACGASLTEVHRWAGRAPY